MANISTELAVIAYEEVEEVRLLRSLCRAVVLCIVVTAATVWRSFGAHCPAVQPLLLIDSCTGNARMLRLPQPDFEMCTRHGQALTSMSALLHCACTNAAG